MGKMKHRDADQHFSLSRLEQQHCYLSKVEVNEMFCLVGHVASKVSSADAMPCWVVLFVEFLLDIGSDVLFDVVLLQSLGCTIDGILLHVLGHISILNDSFAVSHSYSL